jgi:copper chaperone CopZ
VRSALLDVKGVTRARVSLEAAEVVVDYAPPATPEAMVAAVDAATPAGPTPYKAAVKSTAAGSPR